MRVFRIKPQTKEYIEFNKCYTWGDAWEPYSNDIANFLGVDDGEIIYYNVDHLMLQEVPKHLEKQFCKPYTQSDGCVIYKAKQTSKINKEWIEFCKERKLPNPTTAQLLFFTYGFHSYMGNYGDGRAIHKVNDDIFITVDNGGDEYLKHDFIEEFNVSQYLRLKADQLEKEGN